MRFFHFFFDFEYVSQNQIRHHPTEEQRRKNKSTWDSGTFFRNNLRYLHTYIFIANFVRYVVNLFSFKICANRILWNKEFKNKGTKTEHLNFLKKNNMYHDSTWALSYLFCRIYILLVLNVQPFSVGLTTFTTSKN